MPRPLIDAHLDLAYLALNGRDLTADPPPGGTVTLPALRAGGVRLAFATIYTEPGGDGPEGYADDPDAARAAGIAQLDVYRDLEARGACRLVRSAADLAFAAMDVPALVLLMEGADPIRDPDDVAWWHDQGLRFVGLTWALGTRYAGGNARPGPLTDAGRALVSALDAAGVAHDVSHLADDAFDDLLAHATGPIVATHSNCRARLAANQRHLTDDQIRAIAARDGVVGLNLYTAFLATDRRATLDDALDHVEHVADIMGHRRGVGLGSDMDGGFGAEGLPENLEHPTHLARLAEGLAARGWSEDDVDGFCTGNWMRLLQTVLG